MAVSNTAPASPKMKWQTVGISVIRESTFSLPNGIRLHLAIYFLPFPGKAINSLHGANCAELFGI
jgi:hypothetical protein